jgi:hypothetical protein
MALTPQVILGLVEEESPTHGYGLKRRHEHHFRRARPLHVGQIYSTLGRLERDGLVTLAGVENLKLRRRIFSRRCTPRSCWLSSPIGTHIRFSTLSVQSISSECAS